LEEDVKKSIALFAATAFISLQTVRAATPVVDGTIGSNEYANSSLQTTPTGFGDNQNELDGAY
jgi:hypothetical protein